MEKTPRQSRRGFTLVELLIVVLVLSLLAAIVIPRAVNADQSAKASVLKGNLHQIRVQISVYNAHHAAAPGRIAGEGPSATGSAFVDQMTSATTINGNVGTATSNPTFPYGPYLKEMPENPINEKSDVQIITADSQIPSKADGSHGWLYNPQTLTVRADSDEKDSYGRFYYEY